MAAKKKELESHIVEISSFRSIVSYLEDTNDWLFSVGESQKVFSDMMCDGRIESLVGDRKDRVQQLTGSITPTGNKAVDEACDRYVNFNARYEAQSILLNAIPYGIAVREIIWENKNGIYAPESFVPVPRQALSFPQDGEYMTPYLTIENKPLNEPYKFLVHRNSTGDGSRWGTPALKSAYWPWKFKRLGFKFWIMAAEKVGVPSVLALFQSKTTEDARARAKELSEELRNLESGSSGAFGNVTDIKVVDSEIKDFDAIVSTCNTEIAYSITGQSLATNQAVYGTKAQATTHEKTYDSVTSGDAYLMQQTLQKLYDFFVEINFPGNPAPIYDIDSTDYASWETVRDAIDRGVPVSLSSLYDKNHVPRPKDEADTFVKTISSPFAAEGDPASYADFFSRKAARLKARALDRLSRRAHELIAESYYRRLRKFALAAAKRPALLETQKTLPPDYAAMSAAAALWVRGALLGIDRAAGKKEFADEDIDKLEVLPFEEALDYMKKRAAVGRGEYYSLSDKLRFRAFTVSRIADGDLLEKSKRMLAEAIRSGDSLAEFWEKTKSEILAPGGIAPGDGWYWETVYRTNLQTAYGAGNAMGFEEVPPLALEFLGVEDERQTEECRHLSDPPVVLPYKHPFWRTHWPPLHFNCRSTLRAIYDEAELPPEGAATAEGFGAYPLDGDAWWQELLAMKERAESYGV